MALCEACDARTVAVQEALIVRRREEATERRLRDSGLPVAYRTGERTIGTLPGSAHDALTGCQLLGNGLRGLYLWGPAGVGKTSVAAAFLASQIRAGGFGRYVLAQDLFTDLYAAYASNNGQSRADIVDALISTPMLVWDDLGKEKPSEHAANVLFEILDGRYRAGSNGRWIVITSNYSIPELCARFPSEVADPIERRITEMTVSVPMDRRAS